MEKYSQFRDAGTGIQPFLTPVPAPNHSAEIWAKLLFPLRIVLGLVRTFILAILLLLYVVFVSGICSALPISPLRRLLTAIITRSALLVLGFLWINVEQVTRKRGKTNKASEKWNLRRGDVIVSNYVSWAELLWLAFRFDPIFVFPVPKSVEIEKDTLRASSTISFSPGRRTGTGSANISSPTRKPTPRVPIHNEFVTVSLLRALRLTGHVPPYNLSAVNSQRIEDIARSSSRPIVVFPELTTTNGRALARFANIFQASAPVTSFRLFLMCVRYDPPTTLSPTLSHSIPSVAINPLPHMFTVASSLTLPAISIRLLNPSESPSSPLFTVSEFTTDAGEDQLAEVCAVLIAQIGKMKRMSLGWEDKTNFLKFYDDKKRG